MNDERIKLDLIIHDLKGPLSIIESNVLLLMEKPEKYGPLTESQKKLLNRVLRNVRLGRRRVSDALEAGRSGVEKIGSADAGIREILLGCLAEIFELFDENFSGPPTCPNGLNELRSALEKQRVFLTLDENLWHARFNLDREKMERIVGNLLSNALRYRKVRIEINVFYNDGALTISVADDGEGIPPEHRSRIFEKYFRISAPARATEERHGIGLAGALALAREMGGQIFLKTGQGRGAAFSLIVPAVRVS